MSQRGNISRLSPREIRAIIRQGAWDNNTASLALGYAQANVYIFPYQYAFDFFFFCHRNPKPCPVLEVLEPGRYEIDYLAPGADIRTDLPRYTVFHNGSIKETKTDIKDIWQEDFVTFFLGCSFAFEEALLRAHIPVRHIEEGKIVPMYITNIPCRDGGIFHGPLIVSMRPIPDDKVMRAVQITSRYPFVHGAPVHLGSPERIGIGDLSRPDFGEAVEMREGEIPVFWACGLTPRAALLHAKPSICISHAPGCMFISDVANEELATS
jgi:uncharacterized protein YcsI (UPF0317 family)